MAAKAASECAHAQRDESVYEPWDMTPRERELATKYIKLIQGKDKRVKLSSIKHLLWNLTNTGWI